MSEFEATEGETSDVATEEAVSETVDEFELDCDDGVTLSLAEHQDDIIVPISERMSGRSFLDHAVQYLNDRGSTNEASRLSVFRDDVISGDRSMKVNSKQVPLGVKAIEKGVFITFQGKGDNGQ